MAAVGPLVWAHGALRTRRAGDTLESMAAASDAFEIHQTQLRSFIFLLLFLLSGGVQMADGEAKRAQKRTVMLTDGHEDENKYIGKKVKTLFKIWDEKSG